MNAAQQIAELNDDQALLLHWVNSLLDAKIPEHYPYLAELVAFTLHQLAQEIPPGPLRVNLDDMLDHMKQKNSRAKHTAEPASALMPALLVNQEQAVTWAYDRPACILALDMGLGKTATAIVLCKRKGLKHILVIVPAGLRVNWQREFDRFWPGHPDIDLVQSGSHLFNSAPIVIVNYDLLLVPNVFWNLKLRTWEQVICDESQMANNLESQRGMAVLGAQGLTADAMRVMALSGTPAPNHVGELHAWFKVLCPDLLKGHNRWPDVSSYDHFLRRYLRFKPTKYGIQVLGTLNAPEFKKRFGPVILRQRKRDMLDFLPPLRVGSLILEADKSYDLRKFEQHPDHARLLRLLATLDADLPDADTRLRIMLENVELATLRRLTALAKIDPVSELVQAELRGGIEKMVLFGHHRELLDGLFDNLVLFQPAMVHGGVPKGLRQNEVDRFQRDPRCRVFVGQIDAAGLGYSLTAACNVLMVEASWVPSKNAQAIDRINRIGQTEPCLARFIGLAGSVDEIVMRVQARKAEALSALSL
jgi:SWI/SNF-related matrix-associated actin-dependent regulator 1 of chromatin subfamily A